MNDERITVIRDHKLVGTSSCTTISECYSDSDLLKALDEDGVTTAQGAVKWAIETEGLHIEMALNSRWGSDTDPELKRYREWEDAVAALEHPSR